MCMAGSKELLLERGESPLAGEQPEQRPATELHRDQCEEREQ